MCKHCRSSLQFRAAEPDGITPAPPAEQPLGTRNLSRSSTTLRVLAITGVGVAVIIGIDFLTCGFGNPLVRNEGCSPDLANAYFWVAAVYPVLAYVVISLLSSRVGRGRDPSVLIAVLAVLGIALAVWLSVEYEIDLICMGDSRSHPAVSRMGCTFEWGRYIGHGVVGALFASILVALGVARRSPGAGRR